MHVCKSECQQRFPNAAVRAFARRAGLDDTEDVPGPKLQGAKRTNKSCLCNGCCNRTWGQEGISSNSGNWSIFGWVRKSKPTEHVGGFSELGGILALHTPAHLYRGLISAPSVQGETLWVPKLMGQKDKNLFSHGLYRSWSKSEKSPLLCLLSARDKRVSLGRVTTQGFH